MKIFLKLLAMICIIAPLGAKDMVEFDYELDAYYSNVSAFIDLGSTNVMDASSKSESELYTDLLLHSFQPNVFLVEAALYPASLGGLYFRRLNEGLYSQARIEDFNLVKAITAGFNAPYSFSFFLGRMVVFNKNIESHIGKNRAYIGYLVSYGDYSIKDNRVYFDRWYEFEFKLKGTREKKDSDLDWSFRVGSRLHDNVNFTDTLYVGARRSSTDYKKSAYSLIYNSAFNTTLELSSENFKMTSAEIMVEKIFPLSWSEKISFGLEVGYIYNSGEKYRGVLKDEGINTHQLLLRPNIKF